MALCILAELDDTFDQHLLADRQTADGPQRGAILVALRQHAQQVAERAHAEPQQTLGHLRTHARQGMDRPIEQRLRLRSDAGRLQDKDAVHLDGGAARQLRNTDRGATGYGSLQYSAMISLTRGKFAEVRQIHGEPHGVRERPPDASATAARLSNTCLIWPRISPLTISIVAGFSGICPDKYTVLPVRMAWL